ncbi:MAG: hypothetical protein LBR48_01500 [Dysgonamonadaceae bacterium]|nr:hypothetical protein [Dysgonamonadaceae bacterium]
MKTEKFKHNLIYLHIFIQVALASLMLAALLLASCSDKDDPRGVTSEPDEKPDNSGSLTFTVNGISVGGKEPLSREAMESETVIVNTDDGTPVEFILSIDPASATPGIRPMEADKKYRVIVYKASDDSFVTEAVFTAGTAGVISGLPKETYKLAAYSHNTSDDPGAAGSDADKDGNEATITVDPENDLLHWTGSANLTSGSAPAVAITFEHRFPLLTVSTDASLTSKSAASTTSATLTPNYKGVQTLLSADGVSEGSTAEDQTFSWSSTGTQSASSSSRYVFTGDDSPVTIAFSNLSVNDASADLSASFSSSLKPGYQYVLTTRLQASTGDYYPIVGGKDYEVTIPLGSNDAYTYTDKDGNIRTAGSLTFLTYNLGADPELSTKQQMAYPHTTEKNIRVYGGLWQWGRKDAGHSLRDPFSATDTEHFQNAQYTTYNPSTDTKFVWGNRTTLLPHYYWYSADADNSNMWGNGGDLDKQNDFSFNSGAPYAAANTNNPCPSGYRVPTQYEWALISQEGGASANFTNDYFYTTSGGANAARTGATWSVPSSNQNIVWVRISDKKAASSFSGKMLGYVLYDKSTIGNGDGSAATYDEAFTAETDLTATDAPKPLMFLPLAGQRSGINGALTFTGSYCNYWTSTISSFTSSNININYSAVKANSANYRVYAYSVRCVKNLNGEDSDY